MISPSTIRLCVLAAVIFVLAPRYAFAQTDEIQVYDATIAPQGVFNLTWHNTSPPTD